MKGKVLGVLLVTAFVLLAAGCSQGATSPDKAAGQTEVKTSDPLKKVAAENTTLSFFTPSYVTDEEYQTTYVDPTQKKYPNIHLNRLSEDKDHTLEKLIAAGDMPDLMVYSAGLLKDLTDMGLAYNLDPLIKQFNVDLAQFIPATVDMVKAYSGTDQMIALPYTLGFRALYYNRDIFDKFGVPYPHAKMSWEDTIQLARKVTRTDGGVQYYGFGFGVHPFLPIADEMGLPYVDAKTNKATVNTAQWKTVFDQAKEFYGIPGNKDALNATMPKFIKDKTMAMIVANNTMRNFIDMNWDTTSVPTLKSDPNNGGDAFGVALAVSAQSKHKEAAFAVILNTVSDEMQVEIARAGRPSVLKGDKYVQAFGKGMSNVTNQHLSEILSVTFKKPKPINKYDSYAQTTLRTKFNDTINKGTDTNTALRDASEDIDKYIQTDLSGGK